MATGSALQITDRRRDRRLCGDWATIWPCASGAMTEWLRAVRCELSIDGAIGDFAVTGPPSGLVPVEP
jgi:hypothetical protein